MIDIFEIIGVLGLGILAGYGLFRSHKDEPLKKKSENKYTVFWNNGKAEVVKGENIVEAMLRGLPNLKSLDDLAEDYFYKPGDVQDKYEYVDGQWSMFAK